MNAPTMSFSQIIGPGQTLQVQMQGDFFYFIVATAPVFARPSGGTWCQYYQGTGTDVPEPGFTMVEIQNPGKNAVVFQIVAGQAAYIDKRQIYNQGSQSVVLTTAFTGTTPIIDRTGTVFSDSFGVQWIAISRILLSIQTTFNGDVVFLEMNGVELAFIQSVTSNTIFPPYTLSASGNMVLQRNLGSSNVSVFEIYQAISPGFAGQPPS